MDNLNFLSEVLMPERTVKLIEEDIYSIGDGSGHAYQYDGKAVLYDWVVGSRLYNRLMWGSSLDTYRSFAWQAVSSGIKGPVLDAGCGSLLFTERVYEKSRCPIIGCDESLSMLRRARARLRQSAAALRDRGIILLQADIRDLPFKSNSFETVLSMNVIHHHASVSNFAAKLIDLLTPGGRLYLTSLVSSNRFIGDLYLRLLNRSGWLVRPRSTYEFKGLLPDELARTISFRTEGNMAYVTLQKR
jgi:SAM-dependent methyltransferase